MNARPLLSVVICSLNTRELLRACLRSLYEDLEGSGTAAEVVVVDDGSSDGSADMVRTSFPAVRVITHDERQGYPRANNTGIAASAGEYVLLLNSDTVIQRGGVAAMLAAFERFPLVGAVGPTLVNPDGSLQRSFWRFPGASLIGNTFLLFRLGIWDDYRSWTPVHEREVDWISSAVLMVRRRAWDDVGLFDERFGLYGVDTDWLLRARRRGYRCLAVPTPGVIHHGLASWQNEREPMLRDHLRAHDLMFRKHYGLPGLFLYRLSLFLNSAARVGFYSVSSALGNRRVRHRVGHFRRLMSWSLSSTA